MNKLARRVVSATAFMCVIEATQLLGGPLDSATPKINDALDLYAEYLEARSQLLDNESALENDPFNSPGSRDPFPQDPVRRPNFNDIGNLMPLPRQGSSFVVALEVLYQTLNFYGVDHIVERSGNRIDFRVIESRRGYFQHLDRLQVTFALQEFSRYLNAHMCNQPTVDNFYRVFAQVPHEEIGLRFKFDMAWALLGNHLPREPNAAFAIGTRWAALGNILNSSQTLKSQLDDEQELTRWANMISDIVNVLQQLNRLTCFVDVRPRPREEIRKRIVVNKVLGLDRSLNDNYQDHKDILDEAMSVGETLTLERLATR